MWTQASTLLLLLACCLWSAEAQSDSSRTQSIWDDPITFKTKENDLCTMTITGQGDHTRLRLSCQGTKRSYWCEYLGTPRTCRPYNKNPRHYFVQMMWGLRKLGNACRAPRHIKPHMCKKATDDSQMVFSSASYFWSSPGDSAGARPATQSARPGPPAPTRPGLARQAATNAMPFSQRVKTTQRASPQATPPPLESSAERMARQNCWRSLQGICSYVIGLFRD